MVFCSVTSDFNFRFHDTPLPPACQDFGACLTIRFRVALCAIVRGKQVHRPKRVFSVALKLAQEVEKRRERKRGKPPTYLDHLYLALLILRSYYNWTYRKTEAFLFPDEPCPSFQARY